ncbi:Hypothetical predicted protein [Lecanosticta acicola]|uniref:Uncharacterized protein n=1 Tax=Lecanosticta acicola TaxID=111012 RepID=A0AAI8YYR7_9PEZI|nr:Hypothetical predicted protein [Lecanosticta acicola]
MTTYAPYGFSTDNFPPTFKGLRYSPASSSPGTPPTPKEQQEALTFYERYEHPKEDKRRDRTPRKSPAAKEKAFRNKKRALEKKQRKVESYHGVSILALQSAKDLIKRR